MKTSELIDRPLAFAVALIEYPEWKEQGYLKCLDDLVFDDGTQFRPDINWAQGGPIIEQERITLRFWDNESYITAYVPLNGKDYFPWCHGPTPLIAAMRCYVASKLGEEIDVPEELSSTNI